MSQFLRIVIKGLFLSLYLLPAPTLAVSFLAISDIHYGSKNLSNPGHDTGPELLKSALDKSRSLLPMVDFILVLGDLPTHAHGYLPEKGAYEAAVFSGLLKADYLKKPMFYLPGNNDSLKGNYQPFVFKGKSPLNYAKNWSGACVFCKGLVIDGSHMRSGGYYSSYVMPGNKSVMLIALNTIPWTRVPFVLPDYPDQDKDALEEFKWLERQLKSHKAQQLIIAMHVPPGASYLGLNLWHSSYVKTFSDLLDTYKGRYGEISLITSHTHRDEIRKLKINKSQSIYGFSVPSVSRNYFNNPGIKVFQLDAKNRIANFTTYYTTTNKAWGNLSYQAKGSKQAIFPSCANTSLAQCLDGMDVDAVCQNINREGFYTVKNATLAKTDKSCSTVYNVMFW